MAPGRRRPRPGAARPARDGSHPADDDELARCSPGGQEALATLVRGGPADLGEGRGRRHPAAAGVDAATPCAATSASCSADRCAAATPRSAGSSSGSLKMATVDVGPRLSDELFARATVVATSATLTTGGSFTPLARSSGCAASPTTRPTTSSPSPARSTTRRRPSSTAPPTSPTPATPTTRPAMLDELEALIRAAGGRTLALFTSRRACEEAAAAARGRAAVPGPGAGLPAPAGAARAVRPPRRRRCLFATMGFWQGIDVAGRTLLARHHRPPPVPPARRARCSPPGATPPPAGADPFRAVDLPRAATLLAQGVGRLIRTTDDRGVVAVFDRRLAKSAYALDARPLPPADAPHPPPRRGRGVPPWHVGRDRLSGATTADTDRPIRPSPRSDRCPTTTARIARAASSSRCACVRGSPASCASGRATTSSGWPTRSRPGPASTR